jgi:hypothetical protein
MVIGDFDPAETLKLIHQKYGTWKRGYIAPNPC